MPSEDESPAPGSSPPRRPAVASLSLRLLAQSLEAEKSNNRKDDQRNHEQLHFSARRLFERGGLSVGDLVVASTVTTDGVERSVAGLRVGLVDNSKHNSDQLLKRIAGLLERDHGVKAQIMRRKKSAGIPVSPEIIAEFRQNCDFVVAGVGD